MISFKHQRDNGENETISVRLTPCLLLSKFNHRRPFENIPFPIFFFFVFFHRSLISSWRDHHSYDYGPFRFPDNHHAYEPTNNYYHHDQGMDVYNASTANHYSSYVGHHGSSPTSSSTAHNNESMPIVKPEANVSPFQSAFSISNQMNFNGHHVQYPTTYGAHTTNSPYEQFYNPAVTPYHPFTGSHTPDFKASRLSTDPVSSKQAMFLTSNGYDYKDFSKFCDIFPTPPSSSTSSSLSSAVATSSTSNNDKRRYRITLDR